MRFDESFVRNVLPDVSIVYGALPIVDPLFSIDSRIIQPNELFIALQGTHVDGHNFVQHALQKNAAGAIIEQDKIACLDGIDKKLLQNKIIIAVKNTYDALIKCATAWREQFTYPVIGVTGSMGKTTTKEMIASILQQSNTPHLVSRDNQNTRIGLALNILRMRSSHNVAVFEMGINNRGEMAQLAHLVKPTIGIITYIGHCHMEGLGSLHDISIEKRNIFKYFTEQNIGIINGDQPILSHVSYSHPVVRFGSKTTNQVQARKIQIMNDGAQFILKIYKDKYTVKIPKPHAGIVFNALAAATATHLLGIGHTSIIQALQSGVRIKGRFEKRQLKNGHGVLIHDCYNANPESMKAALMAFEEIETSSKKVVILGDMLELGVTSAFWHRQIGRFLRKITSIKKVILVGSMVEWVKKTVPVGLDVEMVSDWQHACAYFDTLNEPSVILIKGSNGVGLTNIVDKYSQPLQ